MAGRNAWTLYRFDDDHVFAVTTRGAPPVPIDSPSWARFTFPGVLAAEESVQFAGNGAEAAGEGRFDDAEFWFTTPR